MESIVEATILTGPFEGEDVLIPRIPMIPTDTPFQYKRLQFLTPLAFAVTMNKALGQAQALTICGLDLDVDCFSHGQSYVSCSRVGKQDSLYMYTNNVKTKKIRIPASIGKLNFNKTHLLLFTAKRGKAQLVIMYTYKKQKDY